MSTIRPYSPLSTPTPAAPKATAAQRAFFEAALRGAAPTAPVEPARPVAPTVRAVAVPAEEPARPLRPGSLVDIRV